MDVGGADIAAPHGADVLTQREADKQIAEGKAADEIGQNGTDDFEVSSSHCSDRLLRRGVLRGGAGRFKRVDLKLTIDAEVRTGIAAIKHKAPYRKCA